MPSLYIDAKRHWKRWSTKIGRTALLQVTKAIEPNWITQAWSFDRVNLEWKILRQIYDMEKYYIG